MLNGVFFQEESSQADDEEHAKGEPKGDEWNDGRPVVVYDAFKHGD